MNKYDVILIGSGHNGLVTACYLARAGYSVCVLERRADIGGAVSTETMFQSERFPRGFRMDVGSSVHIMIHQTGILEELELHKYGLDYIEMDPIMSYPVPGGRGSGKDERGSDSYGNSDEAGVIHFFKDLDRTLDSIAQVAPGDVGHYRDFVEFWGKINRGVLSSFMVPPSGKNILMELVKGQLRDGGMFSRGEQAGGLQKILSSYGKIVDDAFDSPHMKAAVMWFAAQSGPTPDHPATGDFAGWQSMLHRSGAKHPRGGSGMLTRAMGNFIEAHGGTIVTSAPVKKILIEKGVAIGVVTEEDEGEGEDRNREVEREYRADTIVSNAHVQTTMMHLVGRDQLEPSMYKKIENINVGNGFGMVIRCAVEELPRYSACPDDPYIHNGMQLLAPSVQYMNNAIGDYLKKQPPRDPAVLAMTFSAIDPDVAPSGGHTLYAWAQWHPYRLKEGLHWDDIREREAQKIYDVVCRYAPNMKGKLIDRHIQSPLDIERKHGMLRGNVMHVEMSFDQMFMFRPIPEMSNYKTPIKNLYLSSASCHPGGGVFGAAGFNAANVILKDLKKTWF